MNEPSQSREQIRRAVHRLSSCPPPDILPSENDIPVLEPASIKDSYGQVIFVALAIIGFLAVISATVAWRFSWL